MKDGVLKYFKNLISTAKGILPEQFDGSAPAPIDPESKQHKDHWILSKSERAKGFIRPVRRTYVHTVCGAATSMPQSIAETYAVNPEFYGSTFCISCKNYFPVGKHGDFLWDDGTKVGT